MISLDDFIAQMKSDLARFESEWREGHKEDPNTYPLELHGYGDWEEQMNFLLGDL